MEEFFINHKNDIAGTIAILIVLSLFNYTASKAIRRIGKVSDLNRARTRLITKYATAFNTFIAILALILIWNINIKELGLILSSIFAILGVALFAQWSILSNVTAGVILFFTSPYKIGDRIRILDKEMEGLTEFLIVDIRAYHFHLRTEDGELLTYPNNLLLQKAVILRSNPEEPS